MKNTVANALHVQCTRRTSTFLIRRAIKKTQQFNERIYTINHNIGKIIRFLLAHIPDCNL